MVCPWNYLPKLCISYNVLSMPPDKLVAPNLKYVLIANFPIDDHVVIKASNIDAEYECHRVLGAMLSKEKLKKDLYRNRVKYTWLDMLVKPTLLWHGFCSFFQGFPCNATPSTRLNLSNPNLRCYVLYQCIAYVKVYL